MTLRGLAKTVLKSVGLLDPLRQARVLGWRRAGRDARYRLFGAPDGLPIPPLHLRGLIVGRGAATVQEYLTIGQHCGDAVTEFLAAAGTPLAEVQPILDFGCGCGRVMRRLCAVHRSLSIYGTDINAEQVAWSRANLPFSRVDVNGPTPPLTFNPGMFGLSYAFSVFTHLPEQLQRPWLEELIRVTRPHGYLLLSLHGAACVDEQFPAADRERFGLGELIVRHPEFANTPEEYARCGAYHPPSYVRNHLARGLEVVAHRPGPVIDPVRRVAAQDAWLFRT